MKWILSALTLALAINVHAADRKLGNVVAVERTVDSVFSTCTDKIQKAQDFDPKGHAFACSYEVATGAGEFTPPGSQRLLMYRLNNCDVDATVQNGRAVIFLSSTDGKTAFAGIRTCLQTALDEAKSNDTFKFIVYTVE
jgi:hypothetical protein